MEKDWNGGLDVDRVVNKMYSLTKVRLPFEALLTYKV
jgi:hypothetical protein